MLLDLSNAYGQLDRVGMTRLVEVEPALCKTWEEASPHSSPSPRLECPKDTALTRA